MAAAEIQPLRIFIVENDTDTLKYLRIHLEEMDHAVFEARTVADALIRIPTAECDVLICDIGLEDGTGWELLQQLRTEPQTSPAYAIAMSGFGRNADHLTSEAAGFTHHLVKPFDLEDLDGMLQQAAEQRG